MSGAIPYDRRTSPLKMMNTRTMSRIATHEGNTRCGERNQWQPKIASQPQRQEYYEAARADLLEEPSVRQEYPETHMSDQRRET